MAKRPTAQRDALVRTLPNGWWEITAAADGTYIGVVPDKLSLDAFVAMHRLRVVQSKPKKESA